MEDHARTGNPTRQPGKRRAQSVGTVQAARTPPQDSPQDPYAITQIVQLLADSRGTERYSFLANPGMLGKAQSTGSGCPRTQEEHFPSGIRQDAGTMLQGREAGRI